MTIYREVRGHRSTPHIDGAVLNVFTAATAA